MIESMLGAQAVKKAPLTWLASGFSAPSAIAYGNACVIGNDVYFFGRTSANAYTNIYKLSGTTVTSVTTILRPRFGMRMFGYGDSLYVAGTGTSAEDRTLLRYNLNTNTWSTHLSYPKDLLWSSICQEGPYAYLTASGTARNDNQITRFDMSNTANVVHSTFSVTNVNRAHMLMGAKDGQVYFGAGMTDVSTFTAFKDFYVLNTTTGVQKQLPDLPEVGYFAMSYGSITDRLIAMNPLSGSNATATAVHSKKVLSFNYYSHVWEYEEETALGINQSACYAIGDKFTRIGGRDQTTYYSTCQTLQR